MKRCLSIIFYIAAFLCLSFYFYIELIPKIMVSEITKVFFLGGSSLFLYFGGFFLSKVLNNTKPMKANMWLFFTLYLFLFINLTIFDSSWRRGGLSLIWKDDNYSNYLLSGGLNLVPFKTILEYIRLFDSLLSSHAIVYNLIGNLVCTMPLALFLPLLFKKQNKWYIFLLTITCFVIGIELVQFVTCCGTCDIDDLLLNVAGAMIMYGILHLPFMHNLICNIFFLEKNKLDYRKLAVTFSFILAIIVLLVFLIRYRNKLYYNNLDKISYKIEIIDETKVCDDALELFYEDEMFKYYFSCIKSENVYALINDEEKYLVKEILNNNQIDYDVTIERLEHAGLDFIKEEKYNSLKLDIDDSMLDRFVMDDKKLASYKIKREDNILNIYMAPYKKGKTNLHIYLNDKELIYEMNIDENNVISYKKVEG